MTSSSWTQYGAMNVELQIWSMFLPTFRSFGDHASAADLRQHIDERLAHATEAGLIMPADWTGFHKSEIRIPSRDGASLRCLLFRPEAKEPGPLFVYFHPGGWCFGMPEFGEGIAEMLVKEMGFTVVSVGYRRAPENVFPTAAHDAIDAVKWCAKSADKLRTDMTKGFLVGGTSSGANLAAVAAHQAVDDKLEPRLTGVVLLSAPLCHHEAMPEQYKTQDSSWEQYKDGLLMDRKGMEWFYNNYKAEPKSPLMSPLIWETHQGQPATYIQVMGRDPLRDEALIYERVLQEAGTRTRVQVYPGLPHGAPDLLPMHSCAKRALADLKEGVEWIVDGGDGGARLGGGGRGWVAGLRDLRAATTQQRADGRATRPTSAMMQKQQHAHSSPVARASTHSPRAERQTPNSDANLLSLPHKRHSLHAPSTTNTPPQSPGLSPAQPRRAPSTPNFRPANTIPRSPSVASLRSSTPGLARKSSTSSLRGDPPRPGSSISRRASFNPNMQSGMPKSPLAAAHHEEKPPLRACDVAQEYFKKELARHEGVAGAVNAGTVVIIHDQCYGHRFSRPKTAKSTLSLIMERPERILASVLGISAAYVRLGERHADGSHPPHPHHNPPERIPFKIRKTSRAVDITSQVVTNVHGTKWMAELKSLCDNAESKLASSGKELARDAPAAPGQGSKKELHAGDLYLCPESLNAFQGALGGVLDAVDAVFQGTSTGEGPSRAFVCIRPPGHHCSADFPSGFCWLNNVHVGIEHAIMTYNLTHAAIIDFDLHHGDGSQAIAWARNKKVQNMSKNTPNSKKTSIGYFSLHDINSYPCEDGDDDKVQAASLCIDNAHGQSVWNVHLQSWKSPEQFWSIYEEKYMVLLQKTRQYLRHHTNRLRTSPNHPAPKAAIFLSAGFDASEWETAGMQRHSVNVPTEFYARFTRDVVRLAEEEGTSVQGRVISVLEGGYSDRALTSGVMSHLSGLVDGQIWTGAKPSAGLESSMRQRLSALSVQDQDVLMQSVETESMPVSYDPFWWHSSHLSELENLVNPPLASAPRKPPPGPNAHFSSPTQSYVAKVVDPSKINRGLSAKYASTPSRAPTPPPPEVDWATAAHALSDLLIPSDRQTRSFKPEDLMEVKVKKEKPAPPALTSVHVDRSGRQLRGRKAAPSYVDPSSEEEKSSKASRANRRQTIADFAPASSDAPPVPSASRRMSVASSVSSIGDGRSLSREPASSEAPTNGAGMKKARGQNAAAAARASQRPAASRVPPNNPSKAGVLKGKENDDVDALTTGLKRITLKLPSKEEHDAREREKEENLKAAEAPKKTATRKAPAARAPASKPAAKASNTTKKGAGRAAKSSKPTSPQESKAPTPVPEAPHVQAAATAPLQQPRPMSSESVSGLPQSVMIQPTEGQGLNESDEVDRRISSGIMQPPTELHDMVMTPEQIREQLPMPSFVTVTEPLTNDSPPPRADTPPPPPPSSMPQFVNYTAETFGAGPTFSPNASDPQASATLQWVANTHAETTQMAGIPPMSPPSKRGDLPVFTAHGTIPFAGGSAPGTQVKREE